MRIWKPSWPSEEKATRVLSGETRGEMETVPRCVMAMLVGSVVVHRPDLFVAAAEFDVEDFGLGDAGDAAAEAEDDLVGEAMGDLTGGVFAGVFAVLLGEHLRVLRVLRVEEVAVDDDFAALNAEGCRRRPSRRRWVRWTTAGG